MHTVPYTLGLLGVIIDCIAYESCVSVGLALCENDALINIFNWDVTFGSSYKLFVFIYRHSCRRHRQKAWFIHSVEYELETTDED